MQKTQWSLKIFLFFSNQLKEIWTIIQNPVNKDDIKGYKKMKKFLRKVLFLPKILQKVQLSQKKIYLLKNLQME